MHTCSTVICCNISLISAAVQGCIGRCGWGRFICPHSFLSNVNGQIYLEFFQGTLLLLFTNFHPEIIVFNKTAYLDSVIDGTLKRAIVTQCLPSLDWTQRVSQLGLITCWILLILILLFIVRGYIKRLLHELLFKLKKSCKIQ